MKWVKDNRERFVNIDNWDVLDYLTISDSKTRLTVAYKFYLMRGNDELTLGYKEIKETDAENILEGLTKGMNIYLSTLESVLYYYLEKELDEKFGPTSLGVEFESQHYQRHHEIEKLIGKRFLED